MENLPEGRRKSNNHTAKDNQEKATLKRKWNMGILVFRHLDWLRSRLQQPWTSLLSFCHTHPWFDLCWSQHHPWCSMCWFSCKWNLPQELARTCARKSPFQLHPSKHWLQSSWSCRSSSLRQLPQSSAWHNWDLFLQVQNQFVTSLYIPSGMLISI